MIRTRIKSEIEKLDTKDFVQWISNNQNLIYQYKIEIFEKIANMDYHLFEDESFCINFLDSLFFKKESVSEFEFDLLESFSNYLLKNDNKNMINTNNDQKINIVGLLAQPYDILNNRIVNKNINMILNNVYLDIMNCYIPCDDPINFIIDFINSFHIEDILRNAGNTKWFINIFNNTNLSNKYSKKDMLLLFKYISDIYTNREQKIEYFFILHRYYTCSYSYISMFNDISKRYEKYFKLDTNFLICELLDLASLGSIPDDRIDEFLLSWSKEYSQVANKAVIKCLINDVCILVNFFPSYSQTSIWNLSKFNDTIQRLWGLEKYNVEGYKYENVVLTEDDKPISSIEALTAEIATEATHKDSVKMNNAGRKIYKAYKVYKDAEDKVDSQISKAVSGMKKILIGDVRTEIIEGKSFSAIGLLKKYLGTVAIFSIGPMKAVIALVVKYALKKKTTTSEKRKIIMELQTEIELITEKIEDARGDGNREAKYAMMRTKKELEHALTRIKYGLEADQKSLTGAKSMLNSVKNGDIV